MAMRMPPAVAQQPVMPDINRTSLIFFGGLALILLNFYWANGPALTAGIFHHGSGPVQFVSLADTGLQVIGLTLVTLLAEYAGDAAGSAVLLFLVALWLLWLLTHFGTHPTSPAPSGTSTTGGGNLNVK